MKLYRRLAELERLKVGVGGDEFDALDLGTNHAIDGVAAAASDADDLNLCGRQLLAEAHADCVVLCRHLFPPSPIESAGKPVLLCEAGLRGNSFAKTRRLRFLRPPVADRG